MNSSWNSELSPELLLANASRIAASACASPHAVAVRWVSRNRVAAAWPGKRQRGRPITAQHRGTTGQARRNCLGGIGENLAPHRVPGHLAVHLVGDRHHIGCHGLVQDAKHGGADGKVVSEAEGVRYT